MNLSHKWDTGIVIGGGVAGLISADVLSNFFKKVRLFDRDNIAEINNSSRPSIPQGNHIHILLTAAVKSLQKRFPEFHDRIEAEGSKSYQVTEGLRWYHYGNWKNQFLSDHDFTTYCQTRPVLERVIRDLVDQKSNVEIIGDTKIIDYIYDETRECITGIKIQTDDQIESISGDLIIDATGKSSKTLSIFEKLGFRKPEIDELDINIRYVSTFFHNQHEKINDFPLQAVYPKPPASQKYGVIGDVEGDRVIVTLMGIDGDHPATNHEAFLNFAKNLDHPYIYERIKNIEPIAPFRSIAFPRMKRIHYENMNDFPGNFIIIGDALCHFDPIFGQGMTVAILEGDMLENILQSLGVDELSNCSKIYFDRASSLVSDVWNMVVAEDSRYDIDHDPTIIQKLYQKISNQIYKMPDDEYVLERYYKVINLEERPHHLLHPKVIFKMIKNNLL